MKKLSLQAVILLVIFTLSVPGFVFAQQKAQPQQSPGTSTAARPSTSGPAPSRRGSRIGSSNVIPLIQRDFDEALELIKENYVEGKKVDYNAAFKSSIIGMLRSLDPHSNYFDREEFEELKTDQRSEYFGIGASIYNYTVGKDADTTI